jgi:hypothetical protein
MRQLTDPFCDFSGFLTSPSPATTHLTGNVSESEPSTLRPRLPSTLWAVRKPLESQNGSVDWRIWSTTNLPYLLTCMKVSNEYASHHDIGGWVVKCGQNISFEVQVDKNYRNCSGRLYLTSLTENRNMIQFTVDLSPSISVPTVTAKFNFLSLNRTPV